MKQYLPLPSFFLILLLSSCKKDNPAGPDVNLKKGLLVYLNFNGSVADSSGNNNPATLVGGSLGYDEHGYANSAFIGDGSNGRVLVTNNGSIKMDTAFSVSLHVMIKSYGLFAFASMTDDATARGGVFGTGTNLPGNKNLNFAVVDSALGCDKVNTDDNTTNVTSSFEIEPTSWYNVITVFHSGTMQVYVNGRLIGTNLNAVKKVNICPNSKFIVGDWAGFTNNGINGSLDEVRLYNRGLNADEIAELSKDFR